MRNVRDKPKISVNTSSECKYANLNKEEITNLSFTFDVKYSLVRRII